MLAADSEDPNRIPSTAKEQIKAKALPITNNLGTKIREHNSTSSHVLLLEL